MGIKFEESVSNAERSVNKVCCVIGLAQDNWVVWRVFDYSTKTAVPQADTISMPFSLPKTS